MQLPGVQIQDKVYLDFHFQDNSILLERFSTISIILLHFGIVPSLVNEYLSISHTQKKEFGQNNYLTQTSIISTRFERDNLGFLFIWVLTNKPTDLFVIAQINREANRRLKTAILINWHIPSYLKLFYFVVFSTLHITKQK